MTNLKPCPCGKTPTRVIKGKYWVYGDCCYVWTAPCIDGLTQAEAWNAAPRAVPIVCPACEGDGVVTDAEALLNGKEYPTVPCPTCAPFGGRGAIMVESEEAGDA